MMTRRRAQRLGLAASLALAACGARTGDPGPEPPAASAGGAAESVTADRAVETSRDRPLVIFLGDSLTAGLGVSERQAFPAQVGTRLAASGRPVRVVNAGVSGDTTAGGLSRLDWLLEQRPQVMVVELGANDGLRGLSLEETAGNLREIVRRSREGGARVLLVGIKIPPSYGPAYSQEFEALFPRLAEELDVARVPFLLEGVAAEPGLNLADGIHPNAAGHRRLAENVLPWLQPLLEPSPSASGEAPP